MRYHLADVVDRALRVLDEYGLADVSMRRLAGELGVQPSAIYHHVSNKQQLLALMVDEILRRGRRTPVDDEWPARLLDSCTTLRDSMLAYRDGAELVATVHAYGLGSHDPTDEIAAILLDTGFEPALAATAAHTLLHVTFGYTGEEQTHLQAASVGAIDGEGTLPAGSFASSISLIIDGLRAHAPA